MYWGPRQTSEMEIFKKIIRLKALGYEVISVFDTISLSRHEQVCLMRLRFERYLGEVSLET